MNTPSHPNHKLFHEGIEMLQRGIELSNIRENLQKQATDEAELDSVINSLKEYKFGLRRRRGGILCVVGALLLVFGCVFVLALQDSIGASRMAIYIPTVIGSGLILWGFVDLLGW